MRTYGRRRGGPDSRGLAVWMHLFLEGDSGGFAPSTPRRVTREFRFSCGGERVASVRDAKFSGTRVPAVGESESLKRSDEYLVAQAEEGQPAGGKGCHVPHDRTLRPPWSASFRSVRTVPVSSLGHNVR